MFLTTPKYARPARNEFSTSTVNSLLNDAFNALDSDVFRDIWSMTTVNYPPFNIISDNDDKEYIIEVAAAGFTKDEIQIESENGILTITGAREPVKQGVKYITHGIAYRNFSRSFTLARDIVIDSAAFEDGLLRIKLSRVQPEPKKKNLIAIA
jgi:molecular chaperone IbpA